MRNYFYYDILDNTMREYNFLKELCEEPLCVRAGAQNEGLGRANHIWLSPSGGLWFTFDYENNRSLPSFALYLGFCIHQCLQSLFEPLQGKLQIKWTNDIIFSNRKLGGILCNYQPAKRTYIAGIGLNTNNEIDAELGKFGAISLKDILGFEVSNDELCRLIIKSVEDNCRFMENKKTYIDYCNAHLFGKGRFALLEMGGINIEAEIIEIDSNGALSIRNEKGELIAVHTGSILQFLD
ncbi:MAG TPA: biotin--[acetyl-CoA-carboxylase] ligase [Candidatus Cloacimonas acidaminovorans]|nr:biotin--[acetyl-CoA-carboxylase] ligase [Candidatus Cloacimonas acidaminovorans]HRS60425.1 biotin--[acetyl-CoA-carboxylase] ligase [Candidatus Cloacimonas sp.]HOE54968.1 biotin--[acetyl-CoA-carboxylase] ligase [Candidatus Cloacimonas acidaminovorans]HOM79039.1 biotin--[acetyl-CoA-carboxylase] ligase [Candidatus Cloacimonas acidaminovorans]HOS06878.1 biotin--[acetyl-CoA-carboxylase] ligase [Candidatus Cloacimonas acidaminovorans]